jgi:hypothetical protein
MSIQALGPIYPPIQREMELFLEEKKRLGRADDHSFYLVPRLRVSADIIPL